MNLDSQIDALMNRYDVGWGEVHKKAPFTFEIESKKENKNLYYFAAKHTSDVKDPQFNQIEKYWKQFLQNAEKLKTIALEEGGIRPVLPTKEENIKKFGESGFIGFLAMRDGVEVITPEPLEADQREYGIGKFSRDEIEYYYFARQIAQWHRVADKPAENIEDYMDNILENNKRKSGWIDFDFSLEHIKEIHRNIFNTEFNPYDEEFLKEIVDPVKKTSIINRVSLVLGRYRDIHIVKEIIKLWEEGKSIFVVFGAGHGIIQEPALRELLR